MFASARRLRFHDGWMIKEDNDRITLIIIITGTQQWPQEQNHIKVLHALFSVFTLF